MKRQLVTVGPLATASANNIAISQTIGGAGNLTLNGAAVSGGVATLDTARLVLITTTGDESSHTFTVYGTDRNGNYITDTIPGPATSTGLTTKNFKTVTQVSTSAGLSAAVTVGTSATGMTDWVRFDEWAPSLISIQCNATGTVNYTVQQTLNDPNLTHPNPVVSPSSMTWINHVDTNLVAATGSVQGNYAYLPTFVRVVLNSGTGTVTAMFIQASNGPI